MTISCISHITDLNAIPQIETQVSKILEKRYTISMDEELANLRQLSEWVQTPQPVPKEIARSTWEIILLSRKTLTDIATFCDNFATQSLPLFKSHALAMELIRNGSFKSAAFEPVKEILDKRMPLVKSCEALAKLAGSLYEKMKHPYEATINQGLPSLYAEREKIRIREQQECISLPDFPALEERIDALQRIITAQGKILPIFQNSNKFWSQVHSHLQAATDVQCALTFLVYAPESRDQQHYVTEAEKDLDKFFINMLALNKIAFTMGASASPNCKRLFNDTI